MVAEERRTRDAEKGAGETRGERKRGNKSEREKKKQEKQGSVETDKERDYRQYIPTSCKCFQS